MSTSAVQLAFARYFLRTAQEALSNAAGCIGRTPYNDATEKQIRSLYAELNKREGELRERTERWIKRVSRIQDLDEKSRTGGGE